MTKEIKILDYSIHLSRLGITNEHEVSHKNCSIVSMDLWRKFNTAAPRASKYRTRNELDPPFSPKPSSEAANKSRSTSALTISNIEMNT